MKAKIKIEKEIELSKIIVNAGVRYWDDSSIDGIDTPENGDGFPCKYGKMWNPIIDLDTGIITNYDFTKPVSIHFKVCDMCSYQIADDSGEIVLSVINDYVPDFLCPKDAGYGDYIIMDISADGIIQGWDKNKVQEILTEEY